MMFMLSPHASNTMSFGKFFFGFFPCGKNNLSASIFLIAYLEVIHSAISTASLLRQNSPDTDTISFIVISGFVIELLSAPDITTASLVLSNLPNFTYTTVPISSFRLEEYVYPISVNLLLLSTTKL